MGVPLVLGPQVERRAYPREPSPYSAGSGPAGHRDRAIFRALAAIAFILLFFIARGMTFRTDDWDLVLSRSLLDPIGMLRPHNEQWITLPAAIFRAVFVVVGLHSYLPYLVVLLSAHVFAAAGLGRLVGALSGPMPGLLAGGVVLFLGSACEVLGQAIGLGVILGTGAGLWAIDALAVRQRPGQAAVLLLASLMSHPVGVVFLALAVVIGVTRSRWALPWLGLAAALFAAWFVLFDAPVLANRSATLSSNVVDVPPFVVGGVVAAAGAVFGFGPVVGVGAIVLLVVAGYLARRGAAHPIIVLASVLGLAFLYGLIAISRGSSGPQSVLWSRYFYLGVPLLILAVSAWFGRPAGIVAGRQSRLTAVLIGLTVVAVVGNLRYYGLALDKLMETTHQTRAAIAIVKWAPDLRSWTQPLFLPSPDGVREFVATLGDPTRDAYVPVVVLPVPDDVSVAVCRFFIAEAERQAACREALARGVGGP